MTALVGLAVSAVLLWWALRDVHLADVLRHARAADPLLLLLAVAVATSTFPLRLLRWRHLLHRDDGGQLPVAALWHAIAIGFMANNVLPFRAGEVMRTYAVTRLGGARFSAALSSIVVERVFDGLAVVALLAYALLAPGLPAAVGTGGLPVARITALAGAAFGAALLAALAVVLWPLPAERLVRRVVPSERFAERLVRLIEGVRHGLGALESPSRTAAVVAWTLVLWLVNALSFYIAFRAFGFELGDPAALLVQGIVVFGIALPAAPGGVGVFELAIKAALVLYAVPPDAAVSYAVTYHATTFVPITLLGAWSLFRTSLGVRQLRTPPVA